MEKRPKTEPMDFPVLLLYGDGTRDEFHARIDVTQAERELMLRCCREGIDIRSALELHNVVFRAQDMIVYSLSLYSANDNRFMPGGLENLQLKVLMPESIRRAAEAGPSL